MKIEKIKTLFEKIKKAHDIYVRVGVDKQTKIFNAMGFVFDELESLGVDRTMSESLLIWGKEFADSMAKEFNAKQPITLDAPTVPLNTSLTTDMRTTPTVPGAPATLEEIEEIFGAKAEDLTPKEQREFALAQKHNALIWRSIPTKGDTVKIEVLAKHSQERLPLDK